MNNKKSIMFLITPFAFGCPSDSGGTSSSYESSGINISSSTSLFSTSEELPTTSYNTTQIYDTTNITSGDYISSSGSVGTSMVLPICGNSVLEEGEQCDDGNKNNNDSCLTNCLFNTCGDGILFEEMEECDEITETENCDNDCTKAICGDFTVNKSAGEECDEGDKWFGTNCYNTCKERPLIVFVSKDVYAPNLGGVNNADKLCTFLANNAGINGKFKAWLWESYKGPYETFYHSGGVYKLTNGVIIAKNFEQLYSGPLDFGIDIDQNKKQVLNIAVWTGIHPKNIGGFSSPDNVCNNWQSDSPALMGGLSMAGALYIGGSNSLNWISCDGEARIFCVQQPWNEIPG